MLEPMRGWERAWDVASSGWVSVARLGRGGRVQHGGARRRPAELIEVWEFEACPFCRKVREGLSELDLDYVCHPVARGSSNRATAPRPNGGRPTFPTLRDPNTGVEMNESEDILDYLHDTYGAGRPEALRRLGALDGAWSAVAGALRVGHGRVTAGSAASRVQPERRLVLFQFEACPHCRIVRERLHELDLDFVVRNVAKGSERRGELQQRGGKMQVPYLIDPNTGAELYESTEIVRYLDRQYG